MNPLQNQPHARGAEGSRDRSARNRGRKKGFKKKIKGKREAYSASQKQVGISKFNTSEACVRVLHCNTVALNPLLSL